jgi:hypothetical protein
MSYPTAVDDIFRRLDNFLYRIKEQLNELDSLISRGAIIEDDLIEQLRERKRLLEEVKEKSDYKENSVNSTIQHIDFLANNSNNPNTTGGKRNKRKTRKTRKMRNHRKK